MSFQMSTAGIDVGSRTVKTVFMNSDTMEIL